MLRDNDYHGHGHDNEDDHDEDDDHDDNDGNDKNDYKGGEDYKDIARMMTILCNAA